MMWDGDTQKIKKMCEKRKEQMSVYGQKKISLIALNGIYISMMLIYCRLLFQKKSNENFLI